MRKFWMLGCIILALLTACTANKWQPVEGSAELLKDLSWGCPGWVEVRDGTVLIGAGNEFRAYVNTYGPRLMTNGDFGVAVTLSAAQDNLAAFSLVGRLGTTDWWDGGRKLDVGLEAGQVIVNYYNGVSFMPSVAQTFAAEGLSGKVKLEVRRVITEFIILANDKEVGRVTAEDAFPDGFAYFGASVRPQNTLTLYDITVTAPPENTTVAVDFSGGSAYTPIEPPLRALADARNILIGGAVEPQHIRCDQTYAEVLGREFNILVAENAFKFWPIHPEQGRYDFTGADTVAEFAETHAMQIRGHTLVWHTSTPDWINNATFTQEQWNAVLQDHITTVVSRYKGRVAYWDVVNEGISENGVGLRKTVWSDGVGPDYIDKAFTWAHAADPDALLFYNDYAAEGMGGKSDEVYNLVKGMVERGIPIHGVGLQMHFVAGASPSPEDIARNIQRLGELGLQVHITELDIRLPVEASKDDLDQQANLYQQLLEVCTQAENCAAFVMWGFTDRYSWVPNSFSGYDHALIFDKAYRSKPAYFSLRKVLEMPQSLGPEDFGASCNCAP
ncbi:MAG TPA: endo-1,4-beta-xylanase [Anaerolineae bacterium]|nr:endo-1,4-beta-xylanase [Anaerolineae bacterium]